MANRGTILIDIANDISETLIEKLGGTGYRPYQWANKINLLGATFSEADTALANITNTIKTSNDKGSIDISIANKIGEILNKKLYTSRGFKPIEFASAISFLTELLEVTKSGNIVNTSDGALEVPYSRVKCLIDPSLNGETFLDFSRTGKNLYNKNATNALVDGYIDTTDSCFKYDENGKKTAVLHIKSGNTYTVSKLNNSVFAIATAPFFPEDNYGYSNYVEDSTADSLTITAGNGDYFLWAWIYDNGEESIDEVINSLQIELGSEATEYANYIGATTSYNLVRNMTPGRVIYGGSLDLVRGELYITHAHIEDISGLSWESTTIDGQDVQYTHITGAKAIDNDEIFNGLSSEYTPVSFDDIGTAEGLIAINEDGDIYISLSSTPEGELVYELETPTFKVYPTTELLTGEYVNLYCDTGDIEVTYRQDPNYQQTLTLLSGSSEEEEATE